MSFKSLTMLTLGKLKQGVKKTLAALTLGRLRTDQEQPTEIFIQPGAMSLPGKRVELPEPMEGNNLAVLLASHSLL